MTFMQVSVSKITTRSQLHRGTGVSWKAAQEELGVKLDEVSFQPTSYEIGEEERECLWEKF